MKSWIGQFWIKNVYFFVFKGSHTNSKTCTHDPCASAKPLNFHIVKQCTY